MTGNPRSSRRGPVLLALLTLTLAGSVVAYTHHSEQRGRHATTPTEPPTPEPTSEERSTTRSPSPPARVVSARTPPPSPHATRRPTAPPVSTADDQEAPSRRVWRLLDDENFDAALSAAQECLASDPQDPDCFQVELAVFARTGDFKAERRLAEACVSRDPENTGCLEAMVTVDAHDGRLKGARQSAARLRELDPTSVSSALADGMVSDLSGDRASALDGFTRACELGQEYACVRAQAVRDIASRR